MANKSPERIKAFEIYIEARQMGNELQPKEIAEMVGVNPSKIRKWKCIGKWEQKFKNIGKKGAPLGSKNAKGHGAPKGNQNARKHGLYAKYMTPKEEEIFKEAKKVEGLDEEIALVRTRIARAIELKSHDAIMQGTELLRRLIETKNKQGQSGDENEGYSFENEFSDVIDQ